jgi:hypothetical protein
MTLLYMTGTVQFGLSPRHQNRAMPSDTYRLLVGMISLCFPSTPVHPCSDRAFNPQSMPLDCNATFFEYVVVDGKRYYASRTVGWCKPSFVHVIIPGPTAINAHREVFKLFQFDQDFHQTGTPLWFARVRWFKPWTGECESTWDI